MEKGTDRMAAAAPAPPAAASQCRSPRCTAERRGVRRELDSWRHRLMHCVGKRGGGGRVRPAAVRGRGAGAGERRAGSVAGGRRGKPEPEPLWERRVKGARGGSVGRRRAELPPGSAGWAPRFDGAARCLLRPPARARSPLGSFCLGSAPFARRCRRPPPSSSPPSPQRPGGGGEGAARAWRRL